MGKARQAPAAAYVRRFGITAHAIERFRERVDEEFAHRPDVDLGNLLDERIRQADAEEITDTVGVKDGSPAMVYRIQNRSGAQSYYAIVRNNIVVTVLDESMLEKNFATGAWLRPKTINRPFAGLAALPIAVVKPKVVPMPSAGHVVVLESDAAPTASSAEVLGAAYAKALAVHEHAQRAVEVSEADLAALTKRHAELVAARDHAAAQIQTTHDTLLAAIKKPTSPTGGRGQEG